MKIAFDHQIFDSQEYGGVSRYAYELAVKLATSCGQKVAIISPVYVNRYLASAPAKLNVMGMPVPRLPKTGRFYRSINSVIAWPTVRCFNPNIVHETYYSSRCIAPKTAKVVLTVYDMIHEKFSDIFPKNDRTTRNKKLAVERADHIICISEQTRQDLIEMFGVHPAKISVVHLGVTFVNQEEFFKEKSPSARPFLLYVGSRGGYKNFVGLLEAYAASYKLKKEFDLICFGGGVFTAGEKDMLHRLEIEIGRVSHIVGDDKLLAGYYKAASAFVYPSLYEGFGIPPLEAMSFDCPVVCSGVSSIPEIVGEAAEMFNPYDLHSIRIAIERVVSDDSLRQNLIARGRERFKVFSWERCARETLDVYRKVLS
jgi:glycosyltransferase involved in cell wall biosynthesis